MQFDKFGRAHVTEKDLCDLIYRNPDIDLSLFLVDDPDLFNDSVNKTHIDIPKLIKYENIDVSVEEFDRDYQDRWFMPAHYQELDIAKWLLDQCRSEQELQRIAKELLLFQEKNLFQLLKYLKYLVDTMRENKIVWGVGRGSSVASYALYLIGIHRIDSLYYDLPIEEFLKD